MGGEGKLFPDCCISKQCSIFHICFFRYNLFLDLMDLSKNKLTNKGNPWRDSISNKGKTIKRKSIQKKYLTFLRGKKK